MSDCHLATPRWLAFPAEVSGSTTEDDSMNRLTAFLAGLSRAVVHAVESLKGAFRAVGIDKVAQRAAAVLQGAAENRLDGAC